MVFMEGRRYTKRRKKKIRIKDKIKVERKNKKI